MNVPILYVCTKLKSFLWRTHIIYQAISLKYLCIYKSSPQPVKDVKINYQIIYSVPSWPSTNQHLFFYLGLQNTPNKSSCLDYLVYCVAVYRSLKGFHNVPTTYIHGNYHHPQLKLSTFIKVTDFCSTQLLSPVTDCGIWNV